MRKRYKTIGFLIYSILLMVLLVGCGNSEKSLKEIQEDLNASGLVTKYAYLEEDIYKVTNLKLIKRNTQEELIDDVYVSFEMKNKELMISGELELVYNYYSSGGWILDEIYPINDFVFTPLTGQTEFMAEEDLFRQGYNQCKLKEHITDLENQIDYFTYDISCEGKLYSINGCVNVIYLFDSIAGEWVFDGIQIDEGYSMTWNGTGTYTFGDEDSGLGFSLYYMDYIEDAALYGKEFYVDFTFDNHTSKEWNDVVWTIDLAARKLTDTSCNYELFFDQNGIYDLFGNVCRKVSDGYVDPKLYTESVVHRDYPGPDIGGDPIVSE